MDEYDRLPPRQLPDIAARLSQLFALTGPAPWAASGWVEEALRLQEDPTDARGAVMALLACSRAPAM